MPQKMMTRDEIEIEFGWSREMVSRLLGEPDSTSTRRNKVHGFALAGPLPA